MIIDALEEIIKKCFIESNFDVESVKIIKSNRPDLCDYQCDNCFKLAKIYHKSPIEIGNAVVSKINELENFDEYFSKVEFVNPGFINISLSNNFINKSLIKMDTTPKFNIKQEKEKTFVLDYGGPNIAKPLHVGHLRPAIIGEAVKRIVSYMGHKTISDVHLGDIGLQIGEVIYACLEDGLKVEDITLEYLNEAYPKMSARIKEDEELKEKCASITKSVQDKENYLDYWKKICEISVKDIKRLYDYLDVNFDLWYGESDAYPYIPEVEKILNDSNLLTESNNAKVVFVNKEDDKVEYPPLIFKKSNGAYLYESSDIATIYERMQDYNPDYILYFTDFRQALHFEQVFRVCTLSNISKDANLLHLPFGTINGLDGKPYKTRSGQTPKLDELIKEVKDIFVSKKDTNKDMSESDLDIITNAIIKFADLSNARDRDYIFDINKFSETTGKTGPYILYTYLRMNKIACKYESDINKLSDKIYNVYDRNLRIILLDLESYLNLSFKEFKPSYIADYIYNLCVTMNSFYQNNHISNIDDKEKLNDWVSIIKLSNKVIKEMLKLLMIDIPTIM